MTALRSSARARTSSWRRSISTAPSAGGRQGREWVARWASSRFLPYDRKPCSRRIPRLNAPSPTHVTLAAVLQVRDARLCVLPGNAPVSPSAGLVPARRLSRARARARGLDPPAAGAQGRRRRAVLARAARDGRGPERHPGEWQLATTYLGLVPAGLDPELPPDTGWHPVEQLAPAMAFDHRAIVLAARERLRAKLSYTNIGFALAPETFTISELAAIYTAALGYPVDPTNLRRILERRGVLEATGERQPPGPGGGRPAAVYRLCSTRAGGHRSVRGAASLGDACSSSRLKSSAGAEWVRAPTLMKSTPVSATARTVSRVIPPDASSSAPPPAIFTARRRSSRPHVVEQDPRHPDLDRGRNLVEVRAPTSTVTPDGAPARARRAASPTPPARIA